MSKPAPSATVFAVAAAVVALAAAPPADAGIRDRLRALHDRRSAAAEANKTARTAAGQRRAGGDAASDWDTIYSAGEADPHTHPQGVSTTASKPPSPAPAKRGVRARGAKRGAH